MTMIYNEVSLLLSKHEALTSIRKVDGSRLTGSTETYHSWHGNKNAGDRIVSVQLNDSSSVVT